jgi:hypothetical protein
MRNKAIKILLNEIAEISSSQYPCCRQGLGMVKGFYALGLLNDEDAKRYSQKIDLAARTRRLLLRKAEIEAMINPAGYRHE